MTLYMEIWGAEEEKQMKKYTLQYHNAKSTLSLLASSLAFKYASYGTCFMMTLYKFLRFDKALFFLQTPEAP